MSDENSEVVAEQAPESLGSFGPACFLTQISRLRSQFQTAIYSSFIAALLISSIMLKLSSVPAALDWLLLFTLVTGVRIYFGLIRHAKNQTIRTASEWYGFFLLGCLASGVLWSYLGISVIPGLHLAMMDLVFMHALCILFIAGLSAGAMFTYRFSLPALLAFSLPAVVPYGIYLAIQDGFYLPIFGMVFLIYYLFIVLIASHHSQKVLTNIRIASGSSDNELPD